MSVLDFLKKQFIDSWRGRPTLGGRVIRQVDYNLAVGEEGFVVITTTTGLVRYLEPPFELHFPYDVPKDSDMVELDFPAPWEWSSPRRDAIPEEHARAIERNIFEALRVLGWSPRERS